MRERPIVLLLLLTWILSYSSEIVVNASDRDNRCAGTLGNWCQDYINQAPVAWKSMPKYEKDCVDDCSGVGQCNYMTGECLCPAGTTGVSCSERELRPCTDRFRTKITDPVTSSHGMSGSIFTASRCAGVCDEDFGHCYCSGKYGRKNAVDAPPGSPPIERGRPLPNEPWSRSVCGPKTDENGEPSYGNIPYDDIFGPEGLCNADVIKTPITHVCRAPCLDDLGGPNCDIPKLQSCISQCNGHGDCHLGFCKCHEGYFGHDCALLKAGATPKPYAKTENARDPPPKTSRKSPLIYIYDLPTIFNSRLLQYRTASDQCSHRFFDEYNNSRESAFTYAIETGLHELIAQSEHRTFDPEEADYFYMPVYASCYMWPIFGFADFPWFYGVGGQRPAHYSHMMLQAQQYVKQAYPYWNASGGTDHIFLFSHDEASCYVPAELRVSTILTHWGATRRNKVSQTAWPPDDYSVPWVVPELHKTPWQYILDQNLPCFDPVKDLVIPALRPVHYVNSPMVGRHTQKKTKLLFFRGDLRLWSTRYSQGIRQELFRLAEAGKWREKYNIFIGSRDNLFGDYSDLLSSSIFCAVLPGDGYSTRATEAITNGCIPVVIQDDVQVDFETVLNWGEFAVRVKQSDLLHIPEILMAISPAQIEAMQKKLGEVWHRFIYTSMPLVNRLTKDRVEHFKNHRNDDVDHSFPNSTTSLNFDQDDAFETIMGFLHHRIPFTRGHKQTTTLTGVSTLQYLEFEDDADDDSVVNASRLTHKEQTSYEFHPKDDNRVIGRRKRLRQRRSSYRVHNSDS